MVVLWVLCFDFGGCDLICDLVGFWVLLRFDFGWVLAVVVVVIWFWLGFGSGAWLEMMSVKNSGHGGLEGVLGGQPWNTV